MGRETERLRDRLAKSGRGFDCGYEVQRGRHAKWINEDNVTTWNSHDGGRVTAEEDDETGLLNVFDLTASQAEEI